MGTRQIELPGTTIKKSNALARAKWPVASAHEPALVALVAARVNESDEDFHTYRIPISELIGKYSSKKDRQHLKSVIRGLMGRVIEINDESGWTMYQVFSKCRYLEKEASLMVQFHPELKSHYIGLKSRFTCYGLKEFLRIPGAYPKRLYEILKSWDDLPEKTINLIELRQMVGVTNTLPRWQDFKTKVLARSQKLIHENTSLRYEWEPIKTGRKITAIRFIFSKPRKNEIIAKEKDTQEKKAQKAAAKRHQAVLEAAECYKSGNCKPNKSLRCTICKQFFGTE